MTNNKFLLFKYEAGSGWIDTGVSCVSLEQAIDHCEKQLFEGYILEIKEVVSVSKKVVFHKWEDRK